MQHVTCTCINTNLSTHTLSVYLGYLMVGITNDKKFQKYLLVLICYNKNTKDNFQTTYLKKKT